VDEQPHAIEVKPSYAAKGQLLWLLLAGPAPPESRAREHPLLPRSAPQPPNAATDV
jgi:hypothetical protein